jgi:hypothetical protein
MHQMLIFIHDGLLCAEDGSCCGRVWKEVKNGRNVSGRMRVKGAFLEPVEREGAASVPSSSKARKRHSHLAQGSDSQKRPKKYVQEAEKNGKKSLGSAATLTEPPGTVEYLNSFP